jgi:hypothetical protein
MKRTISYALLILAIVISLPVWIIVTMGAIPQIFSTLFVSPQEQFGPFAVLQVFDYTINVLVVLATLVVPVAGIPVATYFLIISLRRKDLASLTIGHHVMWIKSAITVLALLIVGLITGQDAAPGILGNILSSAFFVLAPVLSLIGLLATPTAREQPKQSDL